MRAVHLETRHRCPSNRSDSDDLNAYGIDSKVLITVVATWVKERNFSLSYLVLRSLKVGLKEVAGTTGKSKVIEFVGTTMGLWDDMLYLIGEIEDDFRGMAILTTIGSTRGDWRIEEVHGCFG